MRFTIFVLIFALARPAFAEDSVATPHAPPVIAVQAAAVSAEVALPPSSHRIMYYVAFPIVVAVILPIVVVKELIMSIPPDVVNAAGAIVTERVIYRR